MKLLGLMFVCSVVVAYAASGPQESSPETTRASVSTKAQVRINRLLPTAQPATVSTSLADPFGTRLATKATNMVRPPAKANIVAAGSGIVYTCDATIDTLGPAGTCDYLNTTIAGLYSSTFTNASANIYITYGSTGLGQSQEYENFVTYSQYLAALTAENGGGTVRADAIASLPATEPALYGGADVEVTAALYTALGFGVSIGPATGTTSAGAGCSIGTAGCYNAIVTLATPTIVAGYGEGYWYRTGTQPANYYDFYTVVEHETDEVLGTASCVDTTGATLSDGCDNGQNITPSAVDLYRYNAGNRVLISTTPGAYFSYNGGVSNGADGADYNTLDNGEDYADFATNCEHVQDATGCLGMSFDITNDGGPEINILDAVGYNLAAAAPPEVGTLTTNPSPPTGAGPITFTATFISETVSYTDLTWSYLLINNSLSAADGCYLRYYEPTDTLYLENDSGTGVESSATLEPGSGTLSNSHCSVNAGASSASGSGSTLTLNLSITSTGLAGTQNIYLYTYDADTGLNSGWQNKGTWTPVADAGPANVSVTPNPAAGATATLTASWSEGGSYSNLRWAYLLVNTSLSASDACYVRYYQPSNSLYLTNDAGTALTGPITPGSGTLSNSQCTINGAGTTVTGSGTTLTLNLSVTATGLVGTQNVYIIASDNQGLNSGWSMESTWTPTADTGPTNGSVSPNPALGSSQTFTATWSASTGASYTSLRWAYFLANTSLTPGNGCYVRYYQPNNTLYLMNDAGTALLGPITVGSGTLANSQCTVNGGSTTVSGTGSTLTLKLSLTWTGAAAKQNVYLYAADSQGLTSGWQMEDTWTPGGANTELPAGR